MKKDFRLTLDFSVQINEKIEKEDKKSSRRLNRFLKEFLNNEQAILDIYKIWLISDLQSDTHIAAIEQSIAARDEKGILKSVLRNLSGEDQRHFLNIIDSNNNNLFLELDQLFEQFLPLIFHNASFTER